MPQKLIYPNRDQVSVVLNKDEKEALKRLATAQGTDVSRFVRSLILDQLAA